MQEVLVIFLFVGAVTYLVFFFFKNTKGDAGCASNCGCDSAKTIKSLEDNPLNLKTRSTH